MSRMVVPVQVAKVKKGEEMETLLDLDSLSSARQKTPHEYATACPACGGHDRFVILPHRPPTGRYFCRQCGASGDGIDYLRTFEGMSYPDACRAFGITPKQYTRQGRNAPQARNMGHFGAYQRGPAQRQQPFPCKVKMPSEQWQAQAAALFSQCADAVGRTRAATDALYGWRRLHPYGAERACIGYNARPRYLSRRAWGLPQKEKENGNPDCLYVPAGLLIATKRAGQIVALTVRLLPGAGYRFLQVDGSANVPHLLGNPKGRPVLIMDAAIDAATAIQEAGDLCACMALMGEGKTVLDQAAVDFLKAASCLVLVPDNDGEEKSKATTKKWGQFFTPLGVPLTVLNPAASCKDLNAQLKASTDIYNADPPLTVRRWAALARHKAKLAIAAARQGRKAA